MNNQRTTEQLDSTFLLELAIPKRINIKSGDLFEYLPEGSDVGRHYSIGVLEKRDRLLLAIKKHDKGVASKKLSHLKPGESVNGRIVNNAHFHLPSGKRHLAFIANGTGIGPFLGMLDTTDSTAEKRLYFGLRTKRSFELYQPLIQASVQKTSNLTLKMAYSKEVDEFSYVQDSVERDLGWFVDMLVDGGVIMICGSLKMRDGVLKVLDEGCQRLGDRSAKHFVANKQILSDCY